MKKHNVLYIKPPAEWAEWEKIKEEILTLENAIRQKVGGTVGTVRAIALRDGLRQRIGELL